MVITLTGGEAYPEVPGFQLKSKPELNLTVLTPGAAGRKKSARSVLALILVDLARGKHLQQ